MFKKLCISLIFSNLVATKLLSSNHRMHNLYTKFVKILEICKQSSNKFVNEKGIKSSAKKASSSNEHFILQNSVLKKSWFCSFRRLFDGRKGRFAFDANAATDAFGRLRHAGRAPRLSFFAKVREFLIAGNGQKCGFG